MNFNPRPREEGDAKRDALKEEQEKISIHALVKRATTLRSFVKSLSRISIHALVKRATDTSKAVTQSTEISIHALVKRATP